MLADALLSRQLRRARDRIKSFHSHESHVNRSIMIYASDCSAINSQTWNVIIVWRHMNGNGRRFCCKFEALWLIVIQLVKLVEVSFNLWNARKLHDKAICLSKDVASNLTLIM